MNRQTNNKLRRFGQLLLLAVLFNLGVWSGTAAAHNLGNDSVDDGEIRWEDSTKWDDERRNSLFDWDEPGCVDFAPDNWRTVTDLEFRDYRDANTNTTGFWQPRFGADRIFMNDHWMDQNNWGQRHHNMLHEVGHATGLGHNNRNDSVMKQGRLWFHELGNHDVDDHEDMWCN